MTTKAEKAEEKRLARVAGWSSDSFRFREDERGNLFIAPGQWLGPEALLVKPENLAELLGELEKVKDDILSDAPDDEQAKLSETPPVVVSTDPEDQT